jgi:hypothetical protein
VLYNDDNIHKITYLRCILLRNICEVYKCNQRDILLWTCKLLQPNGFEIIKMLEYKNEELYRMIVHTFTYSDAVYLMAIDHVTKWQ